MMWQSMRRRGLPRGLLPAAWALLLATLVLPSEAAPQRGLNDYGQIGLLQTPTARSGGTGTVGGGFGTFSPYRTLFFHLQPLDWIQGTFRYAEVTNRDYSFVEQIPIEQQSSEVSRHFTDKGVDIQLRLLDESEHLPAVALGLMDLAGTGIFASEYLVASRRYFNWDFHLGIGWGRLGSADDFRSPLAAVSSTFEDRPRGNTGLGGRFEVDTYFRGPAALFGGVQWTPGGGPLSLFAELEGNDYQSERLQNPQEQSSRVNLGMSYRLGRNVDLGLAWERGDTLAARVSIAGNLGNEAGPQKVFRPTALPLQSYWRMQRTPFERPVDPPTVERLARDLRSQGLYLLAVDDRGGPGQLTVWYSQTLGSSTPMAPGRVVRALIRQTGVAYDEYELVEVVGGLEAMRLRIEREAFHRAAGGSEPAESIRENVEILPTSAGVYGDAAYRDLLRFPAFSSAINPQFRSNIGGPDAFVVGQLLARFSATVQLSPGWSVGGALGVNIADNIGNRLQETFPSGLPRVRSDIGAYLREGKDVYLSQLETNYRFPIAEDLNGRVSAGIFEEMFGGVATEVLYRPTGNGWAVGVELARLRQREFRQRFGFRDYETTTGFVSYYHELPWKNLRLVVSGGRFLAGDWGATIDLSRRFSNGVRVGVFATPTNASTEEFGEGSFDKGFYLSIPVDLFSMRGGPGTAEVLYRPLSRDGGQKARTGRSLYESLESANPWHLRDSEAEQWLR